MPRIKRHLAVLLALTSSATFADEALSARYPDADAVLADCSEYAAYEPDGTYTKRTEHWITVLTEKGRRDEAELMLRYSARYARAKFLHVGVIGTNGVERTIDLASATKESTDNSSMSENIYDPLDRRLVCAIPGLQIGETVHYVSERVNFKARAEGIWSDVSVSEWSVPVIHMTARIKAPPARPLRKIAIRHPLGNVSSSEEKLDDGSILYTWTTTNSPQAFPEPDMPTLYTQLQNLQVSTAADWHEVSQWYWNVCAPHLAKADEAITNKVQEIVAGLPDDSAEARMRAIYKWVAQEIRYMGLTMEDTSPGYAPHDVDVTFANRYGVCRDKAGLLVAMLRIAGLEAYPVLIHVGPKKDPEVPSPFFNHAIVGVAGLADLPAAGGDGRYLLMDPTDESSRDLMPAYLSDKSYLVARPDGEGLRTSPTPAAEANALVVESTGELSEDGSMLLEQRFTFNGINDNAFRHTLLRRRPEDRRKMFETILRNRFPGAELLRCDISPADLHDTETKLSAVVESRLPETVLRGETRDEVNPPLVTTSLGYVNWMLDGKTSLETRRFPLTVNSTASVVETLRLKLGDSVGAPCSLPKDVDFGGKYAYSRSFRVEDGVLTVRRRAAVDAVEFSPEEYASLRERIKDVEAAERERPLFDKELYANARVRYALNRTETHLCGDRAWTVTNTVVKEILTYDGKKRSAELKYEFNPTWESVEVVSAVVSNKDGRVSRLGAGEVNVMDCSWAAAAPRYPASRQLIVNLPSVEVGSVVSYVVVHTATNAPAPFYGKWYFDVYEPTDELDVRLGDWSRTVKAPKLLKNEAMTPPGDYWRDHVIVSSNSFERAAEALRAAADVRPLDPAQAIGGDDAPKSPSEIRDWMAKHVRVAGPSLYELPIELQLTDPETVLKERYGTRLDYVRTLCALMKGIGCEASVVFSSLDGGQDAGLQRRTMYEYPNVRAFSSALCRVCERSGGWLWGMLPFGRTERVSFVGTENEHTPFGATSFAGSHYLDPADATFGTVTLADSLFKTWSCEERRISVRVNGAVDFDVERTVYGPGVGAFRRKYAEMLPENRSRHHQELLGGIAQAASATGELVTDTSSYPAKLSFSCYVPAYATVRDDAISLTLPSFSSPLFPLSGLTRAAPIDVPAMEGSRLCYTVTFPEGYTEVEHLPSGYAFRAPVDFNHIWYENRVTSRIEDGKLVVEVVRERSPSVQTVLSPEYFGLLRDWNRIGSSRSNRTITVRKPVK